MLTLNTDKNTRTGYRAVQISGDGYRWRLNEVRLQSIIHRPLTETEKGMFAKSKTGVILSTRFTDKKLCASDLCQVIYTATGLLCHFD